uniref:PHD finger protein 20-like protein 1 n=1 Tax=Callorhinchus milii TaxID=7868 RepID=A0A4W3GFM8_CALMI
MSKKPPTRPGIVFEVGARLEAQDYLQKWYTSRIEKMDYEEGRMLIHFERWSHRYDEWIYWDSHRLRPLDTPSLKKEALRGDHELRVSDRPRPQPSSPTLHYSFCVQLHCAKILSLNPWSPIAQWLDHMLCKREDLDLVLPLPKGKTLGKFPYSTHMPLFTSSE